MHGLTEGRSVRPAVRPGEGNSPTIKPYREYVPFLRSRPGQLPKIKETFLHGHSILHDRLVNEIEKSDIETIIGMRLANEIF